MSKMAACVNCGKELIGKPYYMGQAAYIPGTLEQAKHNHYGGFVCSEACDRQASFAVERSMPGYDYKQSQLSFFAARSLKNNWQ